MPPKTRLLDLLRKDIRRSKSITVPRRARSYTSPKTTPEDSHDLEPLVEDDTPDSDTGSLFGETIIQEKTKEEKQQDKLKKLLLKSSPISPQKNKDPETSILSGLRKDLEELVTREGMSTWEERLAIRTQKRTLIRKITACEAEVKDRREKELKSTLDNISTTLPTIGPEEKKKQKIKAEQILKTIAGLEKVPRKRNRDNTDNDLDGEERLRNGKSYRRPATKATGHWGKNVHDYFPDFEGKGSNIDRDTLTAEQRLLNRRELAELGEALAKAKRKKKLLEGLK